MDLGFHQVDILFLGVLFWSRYGRRSCLIRTDRKVFKERVLSLGSAIPIVVLVLVAVSTE
jgi:hypothetical protein